MKICTFFGHRDAPGSLSEKVRNCIIDLIENKGVCMFYVGTNGNFDVIVTKELRELKNYYCFEYAIVLAYIPKKEQSFFTEGETIFPEGMENVLPKFAILKRNMWMLERSDCVVTYVRHSIGNAHKFMELSKRKAKVIVEI